MSAPIFRIGQLPIVGADTRPAAVQRVCAAILQVGDELLIGLVGLEVVGVTIRAGGPKEGVSHRSLVVRFPLRLVM